MPPSLFADVNHICIASRDLDRAVRTWCDRYGVGPWRVFDFDTANMTAVVDGNPAGFRMRAALCQLGDHFRIEIIQPLDDLSPYAESLARHDEADHIHHVRLNVDDFDATLGQLQAMGVGTEMYAKFTGGGEAHPVLTAVYLQTERDLGFRVEVATAPPGFLMADPVYTYPPAG